MGWALYGLLGISRGEKEKMRAQQRRNYLFFDAPVGMIFTIDRVLEVGSWLDYGMFLQNVMVGGARSEGWIPARKCRSRAYQPDRPPRASALADGERVICGMALGPRPTPQAPENRLETEREPVSGFARIRGFE